VVQRIDARLETQLQFEAYRRSLPQLGIEQLRRDAERLAELALVSQPAVIRWLIDEAMEQQKGQVPPIAERHLAWAGELTSGGDHQA
jgi:hypothetical protein